MNLRFRISLVTLLLTAALAGSLHAAPPLTLERIMSHPDWIGNPPENPYWADDGRAVFYERKRTGEDRRDLIRLDLATGESRIVPDAERGAVDVAGGELNRERTWKVYERRGDIYLKDLTSGALHQVTRTAEEETEPRFLVDGARISFRRENAFFVYDRATGLTRQVVDVRLAKDPAEEDDPTYLTEQQTLLFEVIREQREKKKREREQDQAEQKADPTRPPLPFYLGEEVAIEAASLSPSGEWLLLVTAPKRGEGAGKPSKVPTWVTESGYVEVEDARSKVGTEAMAAHSVLVLDLKNHEKHDVDLGELPGIKDDPLKALREAAEKRKKKDEKDDAKDAKKDAKEEPKARDAEVWGFAWSDDGGRLAIQLRARDNKDRWLATFELDSKKLVNRHRLTDPAWINWAYNDFGWLRDNETLWYLSEESGWSQLYLISARTGQRRRLTDGGRYEVISPAQDRAGRYLYYTANQAHPGIYETWRIEAATGKAEQLTKQGGISESILSPDEGRLLVLHSSIARPNELYLMDNRPTTEAPEARQLTQTRTAEFLEQEWTMPEIVPIPSKHGAAAPIYSRVYTPKDFDPARKYPAVVFTHGAGYLQNIHYGWSTYFREFMFHSLLTQHGYVVLDMDYRASQGYGRDWRTAIYRQMGYPELEDLKDGVAWLAANKSVDPTRVGTYGGSYGGFLTFMSLFREPDLFAAGAALRPVSDWAHYNHEYTSNILNTPEVDPEAYEKSSPIEYAAGLNKPLLICAPMLDDNVFFQDTVRLVQRLIELKKENFETAVYPVERHAFLQPTSWLDEYRRIFKLFETHLK